MTGLPDNGTIIFKYCPDKKIIELQYRKVGMFYECVVNKILDDLIKVVKPQRIEAIGEFTPRGGISSKASDFYKKPE
jgi:7-cyano-7-deazaguanine reductase